MHSQNLHATKKTMVQYQHLVHRFCKTVFDYCGYKQCQVFEHESPMRIVVHIGENKTVPAQEQLEVSKQLQIMCNKPIILQILAQQQVPVAVSPFAQAMLQATGQQHAPKVVLSAVPIVTVKPMAPVKLTSPIQEIPPFNPKTPKIKKQHQVQVQNNPTTWLHDLKKEATPELKAWLDKLYSK